MRRLIIMRHGEAVQSHPSGDHGRALSDRGQRQAQFVGRELVRSGWAPELIISSDARRTAETAAMVNNELMTPAPVLFVREFYLANFEHMVERLATIDAATATVLVVGHNPGWSEALYHLTGQMEPLSTADTAVLEREVPSWSDASIGLSGWRLLQLIQARKA